MQFIRFNQEDDHIRFGSGPCKSNHIETWSDSSSDTEARFDENWADPQRREQLIQAGWTKDNVVYRTNDRGFRMDVDLKDIKPRCGNMYLGCSIPFGVGLNLEDTWPWKLNQRIGGDYINLAWPGGGIESQYRLLKAWAHILRPLRIYTIGAYTTRREIIRRRRISRLGPWSKGEDLTLYQFLIEHPDEERITFLRNLDAIKAVCIENQIELYVQSDALMREISVILPNEHLARDLMHQGKDWHSRIADLPFEVWQRLV